MTRLLGGTLALALTLLMGCASYQGKSVAADPAALSTTEGWAVVSGVSDVRQKANDDCGAAALTSVLRYWDAPTTLAEVRSGAQGRLSAGELRAYARSRGLQAFAFRGTLTDLAHEVKQGRPVVVGVAKPYSEGRLLSHYQVVVGLNSRTEEILVMDPGAGFLKNSFVGFDDEWEPTGRVTLVVLRETKP